MNMVYKIYTTLQGTPENMPMYNELTADYINRNYSHDDLLVFKQKIVKNSEIKSDADENLKTWERIHADWNVLFDTQREMPFAKYIEQTRFLGHVIEELRLYFDKAKVKYPEIIRKHFTFSPEFTSVSKHGINYPLTKPQAAIIRVLYEAYTAGTEHLLSREIFRQANDYLSPDGDENFIESDKISDVFKSNKKTYSALIKRQGQSHYRLNLD